MAQLVVRNLDPDVKARLLLRAHRNGRTLQEEVRTILHYPVETDNSVAAPLGSRLRERFARIGPSQDVAELRGHKARGVVFKK